MTPNASLKTHPTRKKLQEALLHMWPAVSDVGVYNSSIGGYDIVMQMACIPNHVHSHHQIDRRCYVVSTKSRQRRAGKPSSRTVSTFTLRYFWI